MKKIPFQLFQCNDPSKTGFRESRPHLGIVFRIKRQNNADLILLNIPVKKDSLPLPDSMNRIPVFFVRITLQRCNRKSKKLFAGHTADPMKCLVSQRPGSVDQQPFCFTQQTIPVCLIRMYCRSILFRCIHNSALFQQNPWIIQSAYSCGKRINKRNKRNFTRIYADT